LTDASEFMRHQWTLLPRVFQRATAINSGFVYQPHDPDAHVRHQGCPLWSRENVVAYRLDLPIEAQLSGIRLDARTLSRIRAGAGQPIPASTDIRRMQLERDLRAKATDHAARRLSTNSYLAEHERLTAEINALEEQPGPPLGDVERGGRGPRRDA
jgi:hypothetical protein